MADNQSSNAQQEWDISYAAGSYGEALIRELFSGELGERSIEVKRDAIAHKTGRVFIETSFYSRAQRAYVPSGIMVSEATIWAIVIPDAAGNVRASVLVETSRLRKLIEHKPVVHANANGANPSQGVLIELTELM